MQVNGETKAVQAQMKWRWRQAHPGTISMFYNGVGLATPLIPLRYRSFWKKQGAKGISIQSSQPISL